MEEEENIFHLPKIHLHSNKKKKKEQIKMKKSSKVCFPKINKRSSTPIKNEQKTNKTYRKRMILPQVSLGQQNLTTQSEHEAMCLNTAPDANSIKCCDNNNNNSIKSRCSTMLSSRRSLACLLLDGSFETKETGYDVMKIGDDSLIDLVVSGRSLKF